MTDNKPILEENKTKPIDKADLSLRIEAIFQVAYRRANLSIEYHSMFYASGYIAATNFIAERLAGLLYTYGIELPETGKLALEVNDKFYHLGQK